LRKGIKEQDAELDGRTCIARETDFHIKSIEHPHLSKLSLAGVACTGMCVCVTNCTCFIKTGLHVASASQVELLELQDNCKEVQMDGKN